MYACVYIYALLVLFSKIIRYSIAATVAMTHGVVNQGLLMVDARIVLKWIIESCEVLTGRCNAEVMGKLLGFEGLAEHTHLGFQKIFEVFCQILEGMKLL